LLSKPVVLDVFSGMSAQLLPMIFRRAGGSISPYQSRLAVVILITVGLGLGAMELWAINELYGSKRFGGPVTGAVLALVLLALPAVLRKAPGSWAHGAVAALTSVVELLFCVAAVSSVSALAVLFLPVPVASQLLESNFTTDLVILSMFALGLIVAARGWLKFSQQARKTTQALLQAERARAQIAERDRELARSELKVLRAQIEPHFLWNTLAHVKHLTRKSPADADAMTGHLIRFLQATVPQTRNDRTTLGAEMETVQAYLELMKIRMGSRLAVQVDMDPSIADAAFPPFLIQTLVENAIKHGIEPKVGGGAISVRASMEQVHTGHLDNDQRLQVEVIDNGLGLMASPPTKGTGMGLRNVRERLRLLYGGEASLRIDSAPGGGVVARIQTPVEWTELA